MKSYEVMNNPSRRVGLIAWSTGPRFLFAVSQYRTGLHSSQLLRRIELEAQENDGQFPKVNMFLVDFMNQHDEVTKGASI